MNFQLLFCGPFILYTMKTIEEMKECGMISTSCGNRPLSFVVVSMVCAQGKRHVISENRTSLFHLREAMIVDDNSFFEGKKSILFM